MLQCEEKQKELFDSIALLYHDHYDDKYSKIYRDKFVMPYLFRNFALRGKRVLDAMCGSGQVSEFLMDKGCHIEALDISGAQIEIYHKRFPENPAKEASILYTHYPDRYFDIVVIIGGLHHIHPYVEQAVQEVHRILKPQGLFLFSEPHAHSLIDWARKIWYRRDSLFDANEASIDFKRLSDIFTAQFTPLNVFYGGNVAYFLVYNSLIFRIPKSVKKLISYPLLFLEELLMTIQTRVFSSFAVAQWRKK